MIILFWASAVAGGAICSIGVNAWMFHNRRMDGGAYVVLGISLLVLSFLLRSMR